MRIPVVFAMGHPKKPQGNCDDRNARSLENEAGEMSFS